MTLATKCPACATVFRVVQDQLRVSDGWVRCGRCSNVFNALVQMVDPPAAAAALRGNNISSSSGLDAPAPRPDIDEPATSPPPTWNDADADTAAAALLDSVPGDDAPAGDMPMANDDTELRIDDHVNNLSAAAAPSADAAASPTPSFMQVAERAQRWQRPWVQRTLTVAMLVASVVLLLQLTIEYRDFIAARWTAARSPLEVMCRWTGCRVEPPRLIEAMVVESSGLTRVEGTNTYRLALVVRNRAAIELAMPAVDLVLSDSQGRIISRRVLSASELGTSASTVRGGTEFALQATLAVAEHRVAGYTIEVFYP